MAHQPTGRPAAPHRGSALGAALPRLAGPALGLLDPLGAQPCVGPGGDPAQLALQVLPALEAAHRQRAVLQGGRDRAARLALVGAVVEPAPGGQRLDVGEGRGRCPPRRRSARRPAGPACRSPRRRRAAARARGVRTCAGPGRPRGSSRVVSTSAPTSALVSEDLPCPEDPSSAIVSRPSSRSRSASTPRPLTALTTTHLDTRRRLGHVLGDQVRVPDQVGLGEHDQRTGTALPGQRHQPLDLGQDRLRVQRDDDGGHVDVGAQHLAVALLPRGRAHDRRTPWEQALEGQRGGRASRAARTSPRCTGPRSGRPPSGTAGRRRPRRGAARSR